MAYARVCSPVEFHTEGETLEATTSLLSLSSEKDCGTELSVQGIYGGSLLGSTPSGVTESTPG